jgi:hypothetical protein
MPRAGLTIVVSGTIATVPGQGGWTWVILQYLLGLRRLGHRVVFVDPVTTAALQPSASTLTESTNAAYFRAVVRRFGLEATSALLLSDGRRETIGLDYNEIAKSAREADVLINVSGVLKDEALLAAARRRVYLDLDPAFTQLWHEVQGIDMGFASHTDFVTIGPAIGTPDCPVPTCGLSWIGTLQPIVLEQWPVAHEYTRDALTTVANWRGYGSITHQGVFYGQKAHALRSFITLPTRTSQRLALAMAIHPGETADLQALAANDWEIIDPAPVTATPDQYHQFVQSSKGEFGIAKTGYVLSRCGWFSDRSICYLASGRPVVAQETGFSRFIPTGEGLLSFTTIEQALEAIEQLNARYAAHARAARALAETTFDSDKVLTELLGRLGLTI